MEKVLCEWCNEQFNWNYETTFDGQVICPKCQNDAGIEEAQELEN